MPIAVTMLEMMSLELQPRLSDIICESSGDVGFIHLLNSDILFCTIDWECRKRILLLCQGIFVLFSISIKHIYSRIEGSKKGVYLKKCEQTIRNALQFFISSDKTSLILM